MNELTDIDLMPFGEHRNTKMEKVPSDYLLWLYDDMRRKGETLSGVRLAVFNYIESSYTALADENKKSGNYIPEFKPDNR